MSDEWAVEACKEWDKDAVLIDGLAESGWVRNDGKRGSKVTQIYRADCKDAGRLEMRIALKDGRAMCVQGGRAETQKLDSSLDYVMYAETPRWIEMGKGEYGPMRAMMFNRLLFEGPKMEAMGNMDPFENFLLLVGKVPGDAGACPK